MIGIREYAALRGITYNTANKAIKEVFAQIGKTVVAGRVGTMLTDSDIELIDKHLDAWKARRAKRFREFNESFERNREEWRKIWSDDGVRNLDVFTVGIVLRYVKTRTALNRQLSSGIRVGDRLATFCIRAGVDRDGERWTGFTAWLLDNGYKPDSAI